MEVKKSEFKTLSRLIYESVKSGAGAIHIVSAQEQRCMDATMEAGLQNNPPLPVYVWDAVTGWHGNTAEVDTTDPVTALRWVMDQKKPAIYCLKDLPWYWQENPRLWRLVIELRTKLSRLRGALVLWQSEAVFPRALKDVFEVIDMPLPGRAEIDKVFARVAVKNPTAEKMAAMASLRKRMVDAALGLSLDDAEAALHKALVRGGRFADQIITAIYDEKERVVNRNGALEFLRPEGSAADVGGMGELKNWLRKRAHSFTPEAQQKGIKPPRGVLMMGISGCGKSLFVKAISGEWHLPLLRLDMGQIYGGGSRSPEGNLRHAFTTAEALAPCILWIDEMEAGISVAGQKSDGGPQSRVLSQFLTWMQEKTAPVFVAATANSIQLLPAEVLRKGRFDEIFYVGLPAVAERAEILGIHLKRRNVDPKDFDLSFLASSAKGFSGAELEQAVASAITESSADNRSVTTKDLMQSITRTVPLSVTMSEQIKKIENWAGRRAKAASNIRD